MTTEELDRLERRATLLKSLAHPSRLLIMEMLENKPCCVGELREAIGADITTVSKHLSVLKRVGLVRDVKRGTFSEYSLICSCVSHLIDCLEQGMVEQSGCSSGQVVVTDRCPDLNPASGKHSKDHSGHGRKPNDEA